MENRNARQSGLSMLAAWRAAQIGFWIVGCSLFFLLLSRPELGLALFWNVLIPVAPAILVIAPGFWRNVCPLSTTAKLPQYLNLSLGRAAGAAAQSLLTGAGLFLLFAIIPLRHVMFDQSGIATAILLAAAAAAAMALSAVFSRKSGWCTGMCPVHPVERLYGQRPAMTVGNVHCQSRCRECVAVCADSIPGFHPLTAAGQAWRRWAGYLMIGAFPGYIWGWFHVPNFPDAAGWSHLPTVYGIPLLASLATLSMFFMLRRILSASAQEGLARGFAASAVACYYWYRLPALAGFGMFPGDGMLIDLRFILPDWWVWISRAMTTSFFVYFLVARSSALRSWSLRPLLARPAGKLAA